MFVSRLGSLRSRIRGRSGGHVYFDANLPIVPRRLYQGGIRLAMVLNEAFPVGCQLFRDEPPLDYGRPSSGLARWDDERRGRNWDEDENVSPVLLALRQVPEGHTRLFSRADLLIHQSHHSRPHRIDWEKHNK